MKKNIYFPSANEIELFETCFNTQLPLLLKGPTGCGKSQLVEFMAEKLNRPLIKVACNEDTNAADLLGRFLIQSGETVWHDGPVTRAIKTNAILYLDEFAEAREDVVIALHPLTDHRREIYLDKINQTCKASDSFMLVISYNPGYQNGLKEIKPSTKQRFVALSMNYLSPQKEIQLLFELTHIDLKIAQSVVELGHKIRQKKEFILEETVSTRLLVNTCLLVKKGIPIRTACHFTIAEVLSDDPQIINALKDFINLHV